MLSSKLVTAMSLAGSLSFNPMTDTLRDKDGKEFKLKSPNEEESRKNELPPRGFDSGEDTYQYPPSPADSEKIEVKVSPTSQRLQLLVTTSRLTTTHTHIKHNTHNNTKRCFKHRNHLNPGSGKICLTCQC